MDGDGSLGQWLVVCMVLWFVCMDQGDMNRVSIQGPLVMTCPWLAPGCLVTAAVANQ